MTIFPDVAMWTAVWMLLSGEDFFFSPPWLHSLVSYELRSHSFWRALCSSGSCRCSFLIVMEREKEGRKKWNVHPHDKRVTLVERGIFFREVFHRLIIEALNNLKLINWRFAFWILQVQFRKPFLPHKFCSNYAKIIFQLTQPSRGRNVHKSRKKLPPPSLLTTNIPCLFAPINHRQLLLSDNYCCHYLHVLVFPTPLCQRQDPTTTVEPQSIKPCSKGGPTLTMVNHSVERI